MGQPAADLRDIFGGLVTGDSIHGSGKMSELGLTAVVLSIQLLIRSSGKGQEGSFAPLDLWTGLSPALLHQLHNLKSRNGFPGLLVNCRVGV